MWLSKEVSVWSKGLSNWISDKCGWQRYNVIFELAWANKMSGCHWNRQSLLISAALLIFKVLLLPFVVHVLLLGDWNVQPDQWRCFLILSLTFLFQKKLGISQLPATDRCIHVLTQDCGKMEVFIEFFCLLLISMGKEPWFLYRWV